MAKRDVDTCIEQMASQVHSPKGAQADRDAVFARLKGRLEGAEARSAVRSHHTSSFSLIRKYGMAASFILGVFFVLSAATYLWVERDHLPWSKQDVEPTEVTVQFQELLYEQETLGNIVAQLSDIYQTPIRICSDELTGHLVTASFSTDEPLTDILSALSVVVHCQWRQSPDGYELFLTYGQ